MNQYGRGYRAHIVILRKLFQIDRHQRQRFIHEFFEGGALF
jgi:hypothetical protein